MGKGVQEMGRHGGQWGGVNVSYTKAHPQNGQLKNPTSCPTLMLRSSSSGISSVDVQPTSSHCLFVVSSMERAYGSTLSQSVERRTEESRRPCVYAEEPPLRDIQYRGYKPGIPCSNCADGNLKVSRIVK